MNASDQDQRPASEPSEQSVPVDSSRRRFARVGLSGTVVLGSLVSKPVLGAVPYHCTVSGQISGNLSRPGSAEVCVLGKPSSHWLGQNTAWPSAVIKGVLPDGQCVFTDRGSPFNGYRPDVGAPALSPAFFNLSASDACSVGTTNNNDPATMLQVLTTDSTDGQFVLGRTVVTSLLNAADLPTTYPVTAHTIIAMFNATFNDGIYPVTTTHSWSRARVIEYLQSLYPPDLSG